MITPHLEKMIWAGKAFPRSFVAGGGQKAIITIPENRFIVIHNFVHFPYTPFEFNKDTFIPMLESVLVTQMSMLSKKSTNYYSFRNNWRINQVMAGSVIEDVPTFGAPVQMDVFNIHETDVSINFSLGTPMVAGILGPTPTNSVGLRTPFGFGKEGLKGNAPLIVRTRTEYGGTGSELSNLGNTLDPPITPPDMATNDLNFPAEAATELSDDDITSMPQYPICNIQYVEVLGTRQNLAESF